jgi:hypothetical protein
MIEVKPLHGQQSRQREQTLDVTVLVFKLTGEGRDEKKQTFGVRIHGMAAEFDSVQANGNPFFTKPAQRILRGVGAAHDHGIPLIKLGLSQVAELHLAGDRHERIMANEWWQANQE